MAPSPLISVCDNWNMWCGLDVTEKRARLLRFAFHFKAAAYGGYYGPPIEEACFLGLVRSVPSSRLDVRIRRGDLVIHRFASSWEELEDLIDRVLPGSVQPEWVTSTIERLKQYLIGGEVYVLALEGLSAQDAKAVHDWLVREEEDPYLGALQIDTANPQHVALYEKLLVLSHRIVKRELHMLHTSLDEDRDVGRFEDWKETGLFSKVRWEDIGLEGTIFEGLEDTGVE
jgi:hypothetical protein